MAITATAWIAARSRVLIRDADRAAGVAQEYRRRAPRFPGTADRLRQLATGLDEYAARCRAAAADPSLRNPTYPGTHPSQEG